MLILLLLFAICLGFTIYYFWKKSTIFAMLGGALWFLFVVAEYPNAVGWDVYRGFAILGTLLAIISWIMPFTWRNLPIEEEPEEEEYVASIMRQRDEIIGASIKSKRKEDF